MINPTIIWDFNGTLLNDLQACLDALNAILAEHGLPTMSLSSYRQQFGFPVVNFYHALGLCPESAFDWEALAESFHMRYLFSAHLALQPGALEAVHALQSRGVRQGVLSALEQALLEAQLEQFGLVGAMSFICGSRDYQGASKTQAARSLRVEAPVVLIGDTLHDAEVARSQGWSCILCSAGHQTVERLQTAGCPVIETLKDLPSCLPVLQRPL